MRERKRENICVLEALECRVFLSAGDLDTDFGTGGKRVLQPSLELTESVDRALQQPDGKLILAEYSGLVRQVHFRRYDTEFEPDLSYGVGGTVKETFVDQALVSSYTEGLALQGDGKMVHLTEEIWHPQGDYHATRLKRYLPSGQLDPSFGHDGIVTLALEGRPGFNWAYSFAVTSENQIIIAGAKTRAHVTNIQLVRLLPDGTVDPSFGEKGTATLKLPRSRNRFAVKRVIVQPDGKILWVGSDPHYEGIDRGATRLVVARFDAQGQVDQGFGRRGFSIASIRRGGAFGASIADVALQPNGKILFSAIGGGVTLILRMNAKGFLDPGFGSHGRAVVLHNKQDEEWDPVDTPVPLLVEGNSGAVFALSDPRYRGPLALLGRVTDKGRLDPHFGNGGFTRTGLGGYATPVDLFADADGGILMVAEGQDHARFGAPMVVRYEGGEWSNTAFNSWLNRPCAES